MYRMVPKRRDNQRKAMWANMNKYPHPPRTQPISPDTHTNSRDLTNIGISSLEALKERSKLKNLNVGKTNQVKIAKNPVTKSSNNQIIPNQSIPKYAGRQAMPMILSSIMGVPISTSVSNAAFDSIVDSYGAYKKRKNIDDALYVGMKSFVKNYTRNSGYDYLQSHVQKKTDDVFFKNVLLGTMLLSSSMIDF